MIKIYTDGGSRIRNRETPIASCASVILREGQEPHIVTEAFNNCTNNEMELLGVIIGLSELKLTDEPVEVYSDSAYVVNCFKDRWYDNWRANNWTAYNGKPVKNQDLWKVLLEYYERMNISFIKVKGHSDDYYNNLADKAVNDAMDEIDIKIGG